MYATRSDFKVWCFRLPESIVVLLLLPFCWTLRDVFLWKATWHYLLQCALICFFLIGVLYSLQHFEVAAVQLFTNKANFHCFQLCWQAQLFCFLCCAYCLEFSVGKKPKWSAYPEIPTSISFYKIYFRYLCYIYATMPTGWSSFISALNSCGALFSDCSSYRILLLLVDETENAILNKYKTTLFEWKTRSCKNL